MNGIISGLAAQYGRHLVCYDENGKVIGEGEAFFQPLTERQWQRSAGALGAYSTDQFLCLAPAGLPLGEPGDGGWVECDGTLYQPMREPLLRWKGWRMWRWCAVTAQTSPFSRPCGTA